MHFNFSRFFQLFQSLAVLMVLGSFLVPVQVLAQVADSTDVLSKQIAEGDRQWSQGKLDEAQKAFEQAVKTDSRSLAAHMKLAGLMLSRNDFADSIQTYQRAIGLDAKNSRAWIGLGISYMHSGRNELSRAAFDEAIKIDPARKDQLAPVLASLNKGE